MSTVKAILSFNDLFTAKAVKAGQDPKFQAVVLFPPGDPQIAVINAEFEAAKLAQFPSGVPNGAKLCWNLYEVRYAGKDYYDARMNGYMVLSTTAKADDRPHVVDENCQKIINNGDEGVQSGMWVHLNYGMSGYNVDVQQGIGGWLNGIMTTGVMGPLGSLSNKPTAEQMFGGANAPGAQQQAAANTGAAPPPPDKVGSAPPPPPDKPIMTATATCSYETYIAGGWDDQQLIDGGFMIQPSFK